MNDTITHERTEINPLYYTYPTYKDMYDNNIIYAYKGVVTSDLVTHVLEIMEDRLEEDKQSRKLSKKVSNVMVECLTNVYVDDDSKSSDYYDPSALLMVKKVAGAYCVVTANYLPHNRVAEIKRLIDKINGMTAEQLKSFYQERLIGESASETGLTGLGIIDLARKSKHTLRYAFKYLNPEYTFFSLEAKISDTSL